MKSFFFAAALMTSGVGMAQTLPAPPAVPAPAAVAAEAAVDHMAMKPAAVPTNVQAPVAPVATAQAAAVPPCSKAVHDECMNSSQMAKHGTHAHAGHHARHHNKRPA